MQPDRSRSANAGCGRPRSPTSGRAASDLRAGTGAPGAPTETTTAADSHWRKPVALTALCLGQFMLQLDTTIVNVALPSIARSLHTSTTGLQWVVDAYIIALASLLLSSGRIGDRSGHRRIYLIGLGTFAVGSGLCALATSTGELVCFRALQGIGAAIELPATLALLTSAFPGTRERAQAVGIWAGSGGLSLVLGPVLGGLLIRAFGWPAVFVVNLPVAALAAVLTLTAVHETRKPTSGRLDLAGQVLAAAALGCLAGAAIEGSRLGFAAGLPLVLLAAGTAALVAFLCVEHRHPEPMLPLGYFRDWAYATANADGLLMGFVMFSILFVFALYFQQIAGDSALSGGLSFIPLCGAFALTGPVIGRLVPRTGHRAPMVAGLALIALGAILLLQLSDHSRGPVWPAFLIIGVGYGLTSTPMAAAVLGAVPASRAGMASATNNTARQIGGVFGIALIGSLLPTAPSSGSYAEHFLVGLHRGLAVIAACALLGATLTATRLPRLRKSH